jgi:hypothetical protein
VEPEKTSTSKEVSMNKNLLQVIGVKSSARAQLKILFIRLSCSA